MASPQFIMRSRKQSHSSGLTLIEMMISVVLTLVVVLAVVNIFDMLGGTVSETRTVLELSAQLRQVSNQLQHDLDRITAPPVPPANPGTAPGFLEIIEGPDRDKYPKWGMLHDLQAFNGDHLEKDNLGNLIEVPTNDALGISYINDNGWYGDLDDVLMFTIASDGEPFKGRIFAINPNTGNAQPHFVKSKHALVIWWVERYFDLNGIPKSFRLHRRQLLVMQDPGNGPVSTPPLLLDRIRAYLATFNVDPNVANYAAQMNSFYNLNDVVVRFPTNAERLAQQESGNQPRLVMSTIEDLTQRENRPGHLFAPSDPIKSFPNQYLLPRFIEERCQVSGQPQYNTGNFWNYQSIQAKRTHPGITSFDFSGEDVALGDVLAFDVRVYDPKAPLQFVPGVTNQVNTQYSNSHASTRPYILTPTDRGYIVPPNSNMRGAFVDLFYAFRDPNYAALFKAPVPVSPFAFSAHPKSQVTPSYRIFPPPVADPQAYTPMNEAAVYDTWSQTYNRDGIDQDDDQDDGSNPDQGNNGLDDNNNGIVDDQSEQEVFPPYPAPLRGIEVVIRALEISSEQVRQVSVVSNFRGD